MRRRGFIRGCIATLAAPTIIRTPGLLMPVRAFIPRLSDNECVSPAFTAGSGAITIINNGWAALFIFPPAGSEIALAPGGRYLSSMEAA